MSETHHTHGCIGIAWAGTAWAGTAWAGTAWAGTAWAGIAWAGTGMAPPIACAGTVTADTGRGVPSTMVCACIPASNCTGCASICGGYPSCPSGFASQMIPLCI